MLHSPTYVPTFKNEQLFIWVVNDKLIIEARS